MAPPTVGEHHDFGRSAFSDFLPNDLAVQRPVFMHRAVYNLTGTNPVGVVGVFACLTAGRDLHKLAAVLPRQAAVALGAVVPVGRIAAAVVGDRRGSDLGQQVFPVVIVVLVAQRVRAVRRGTDVARCVVGIGGRDRRAGRVGVAAVGVAGFGFRLGMVRCNRVGLHRTYRIAWLTFLSPYTLSAMIPLLIEAEKQRRYK